MRPTGSAPAPAAQEHHVRRRARGLLDIDAPRSSQLLGEQYKGKEKLLAQPGCLHSLGYDYAKKPTSRADRPVGAACELQRRRQASSSTAMPRRRWAASTAAHGLRVVPDHAVVIGRRSVPELLRQAARGQGNRREPLRHRAGRGRTGLDRHGRGRRLERRARLHRDLGSGRVADDRVHRPGLLRRDSGHDHQRAARRPVHRHAHAHPAGRPAVRAPTPRTATPNTCCCSRKIRTSASSSQPQALDLADRLQTPVFVMTDLDIGMNQRLCAPFTWDDARAVRPRQGDDRRGTGGGQGFRPLQGRRRRRHPVSAPIRARIRPRAPTSPAAPRRNAYAATPRPVRTTSTTCSGCCASSTPPRRWCRPVLERPPEADALRRDLLRFDQPGDA
jgi:hypothetical protein